MARKRVTGRFYVFLMLVAALVLFLFRDSIFGASEVVNVLDGAASDVRSAQAVIIRDELPATETQVTRVEYVADEHTLVKKNDIVAYVYSLEYSEKKLQELNRTRKNIQEYHKVVLGKELDSQLEVYDLNVKQKALELKSLVLRTTHGNLLKLIDQLTDAMEQRRQYMSANMRSDAKLIKYYDDETQKLNSIESWRTARTADRDGVVSFYMDGYESALSVDRLEELSVADMRAVLAGESLDGSASRTVTPIYRIVDQNKWYLSVLSADGSWNPVIGTLYNFQLEGYEDLVYSGAAGGDRPHRAADLSARRKRGAGHEPVRPAGAVARRFADERPERRVAVRRARRNLRAGGRFEQRWKERADPAPGRGRYRRRLARFDQMTEEVLKYLALQKRLNARSPLKEGVRVLPVTKTVEPARILPLKDAGAAEIGENRVQEALEKLPLLKGAFGIRIIGRLQTNKARYVARIASAVESLDRIELADALQRALDRENRALDVLIEVNAGNDPAKAGVAPEELKQFLRAASAYDRLRVRGLMTVAPIAPDPELVRPCFRRMRRLFEDFGAGEWDTLSMGMSADCDVAAEEGATQVRAGSAIFGKRN